MRTNLAEELYSKEPPEEAKGEDDFTANVEEFEICVARLAKEKVPDAAEPFEETLDSFLSLVFIPTFRTILKKKGIAVPVAPEREREPADAVGCCL